MKTLLILALGVAAGFVIILTMQNPKQVARNLKVTIDTAEVKVENFTREQCQAQFFKESSCLQKRPQQECQAELEVKCGK